MLQILKFSNNKVKIKVKYLKMKARNKNNVWIALKRIQRIKNIIMKQITIKII